MDFADHKQPAAADNRQPTADSRHIECVVAVRAGGERYCWLWQAEHARLVLRSAGRFASDPNLSFTWGDAAAVAMAVRQRLHMLSTEAQA